MEQMRTLSEARAPWAAPTPAVHTWLANSPYTPTTVDHSTFTGAGESSAGK